MNDAELVNETVLIIPILMAMLAVAGIVGFMLGAEFKPKKKQKKPRVKIK